MLPFRFDESGEDAPEKTIVLVELLATGSPKLALAPISTGQQLVELTGTVDEIESHAQEVAGCCTGAGGRRGPCHGAAIAGGNALPGAIIVDVWRKSPARRSRPCHTAERTGLDEMLKQWLIENQVASVDPQRTARTVRTMVEAATSGRRVGLEEESLLDRDIAEELIRELTQTMDWVDSEAEALAVRCSPLYLSLLRTTGAGVMNMEQIEITRLRSHRGIHHRHRSQRQVSGGDRRSDGGGQVESARGHLLHAFAGATYGGKAYKELSSDGCRRSASV